MIIAISLKYHETARLRDTCIVVMVDIVVFKMTVPKYCNLLKLKVKKAKVNLSQAYHWFILLMVMPSGVSCTVVIHVAYAKLLNHSTVDYIVFIHVTYARCETVRQ